MGIKTSARRALRFPFVEDLAAVCRRFSGATVFGDARCAFFFASGTPPDAPPGARSVTSARPRPHPRLLRRLVVVVPQTQRRVGRPAAHRAPLSPQRGLPRCPARAPSNERATRRRGTPTSPPPPRAGRARAQSPRGSGIVHRPLDDAGRGALAAGTPGESDPDISATSALNGAFSFEEERFRGVVVSRRDRLRSDARASFAPRRPRLLRLRSLRSIRNPGVSGGRAPASPRFRRRSPVVRRAPAHRGGLLGPDAGPRRASARPSRPPPRATPASARRTDARGGGAGKRARARRARSRRGRTRRPPCRTDSARA